MKVEARINFYDIENDKKLRKKGEQFEVSAQRGKYLVSTRAVKEVPVTKKSTEKQNNTSEK